MSKRSKVLYSLCIDFLIIVILVSIYMIYYFNSLKDTDIISKSIEVNEKNNITYKVDMLDNNDTSYKTELINDINANFSYSISFDEEVVGEYTYIIKGYLVALDKETKVLNKEIYNSTLKNFKIDGNVINIADSINIDFDHQYAQYNSFKDSYANEISSYITYDIKVFYNVYSNYLNKDITNTKTFNIKASLSDNNSKIGVTPNMDIARKEYLDDDASSKNIYLIISLEFLGIIILCLAVIVLIIRIMRKDETEYEKYKNYLLDKYKANIVKINDLPNIKDYQVLFVDSMKDLVEASNTFNLPINYIEVIKGREATFIILNKRVAYVFKISEKDLRD